MPGKFITVEGGEGVGKSTNIRFISDWLAQQGIDHLCTREPGGTPCAENIRELLLAHHEEELDATAELLLIFAARAQHLNRVIRPALESGRWVLCDRFTDATYAYQGGGRGIDRDNIALLENLVQGMLRPGMTLILDIDPELGMTRAARRGELDRFEREQAGFFDKVRSTYLELARATPDRYRVIDASAALDQVQRDIAAVLTELL